MILDFIPESAREAGLGALAGVEAAMLRLGVPFGRDGVQRALDYRARAA